MRAADTANHVGRTILFVISMKNKKNVQSAFEGGIGAITRFGGAEKHIQKIAGIAQLVIRIHEWHTERVAISESGNGRHFANQAISLFLAGFFAEDIFGVMIESGERRDG